MAGIVAFAATAVLAVASEGIDLFAAVVLGVITATGGGTLRDSILGCTGYVLVLAVLP